MKKTIIALAAASSVALSHGVAVAEEHQQPTQFSSEAGQTAGGSSNKDEKETTPAPEKEKEGDQVEDDTKPEGEAKGSSAQDFFGWKDDASGLEKLIKIGSAVAAVVALLGSISSLFANIEKIVKQFTK